MKDPNIFPVGFSLTFRQRLIFLKNVENSSEIIKEAADGEELVQLLTDHHPNLILMDENMPQRNGIESIRETMEMLPDLKIVAATQFGDDEYIVSLIKTVTKGNQIPPDATPDIENDIHSYLTVENYCMNNRVINIITMISVNKLQIPNANKRISGKARKLYSKFNTDVQ